MPQENTDPSLGAQGNGACAKSRRPLRSEIAPDDLRALTARSGHSNLDAAHRDFWATQISSLGHLRAQSTEAVT